MGATAQAVDGGRAGVVLAVDPARRSGHALFVDGRIAAYGCVPDTRVVAAVARVVDETALRAPDDAVMQLVIEEHTNPRIGGLAMRSLIETRSTWEALAAARGFGVVRVNAATWQGGLGVVGVSKQRKALALALARQEIRQRGRWNGVDDGLLNSDSADAICIGIYWRSRGGFEAAKAQALALGMGGRR